MLKRRNAVWFIVAISVLVTIWSVLGIALTQKQAVPKPQDKLALGETTRSSSYSSLWIPTRAAKSPRKSG